MVKVERSFPAPESLAVEAEKDSGNYSGADVIERLRKDFNNKCYICEMKELQDPEVEHLLPHKNGKYKERMYRWENLFWACGHCNKVKNQAKYDDGILDCCQRDPEKAVEFNLEEKDVSVKAVDSNDREAVLTANLVNEVFNKRNTSMRVYKSEMRLKKLQSEMNVLYTRLEMYKKNPNSNAVKRVLKALLRRESEFAAFKRCYVRNHMDMFPELEEYIA